MSEKHTSCEDAHAHERKYCFAIMRGAAKVFKNRFPWIDKKILCDKMKMIFKLKGDGYFGESAVQDKANDRITYLFAIR